MLDKVIVGSEEWCSFPTLGIPTIKARVDSGAKTSALHAINIVTFEKDSESWVKFDINPIQNKSAISNAPSPMTRGRRFLFSSIARDALARNAVIRECALNGQKVTNRYGFSGIS